MAKHELNYTIIREALGEYLKNKEIIPMYNKKQIKEEAYKLEDLENSKAYLIDKNKSRERMRVDLNLTKQIVFDSFISWIKGNEFKYFTANTSYSAKTQKKYENVEVYTQLNQGSNTSNKMKDVIWILEELIYSTVMRANITIEEKDRLLKAVKGLPNNE
tara:strand:+ start:528 stop:1007 length:480 start_codon:yes stop_codon:yes gene_type:complete